MRYADTEAVIEQVVKFNRFYSARLREGVRAACANEVTVAEQRVVLALVAGERTPAWLSWRLDMDSSYMSRTVRGLHADRLVTIEIGWEDRRTRLIALTDKGRSLAQTVEWFHAERVRRGVEALPRREQKRLAKAMAAIIQLYERDSLADLLESLKEQRRGRIRACRGTPRS